MTCKTCNGSGLYTVVADGKDVVVREEPCCDQCDGTGEVD